jgi:hypothetical protein
VVFVVGWGGGTPKDLGPAIPYECPRCGNTVMYHLVEVSKKLSVFFVSVASYSTTYFLGCPTCSHGQELDRRDVDLTKQMVDISLAWGHGRVTTADYTSAVEDYVSRTVTPLANPPEITS